MSQGPIPTGMAGAASNPATDAETLREIAYHFPELRPAVAANPSAYPGLLQWLGELGDPAVSAALAARGAASADATRTLPSFAPGSANGDVAWDGTAAAPLGGSAPGTQGAGGAQASSPLRGTQMVADGLNRGAAPAGNEQHGSSRGLKVTLLLLLALAAVLVLFVILIFNGVFGSGSPSASPTPTSQSGSSQAQDSSSPTPSDSATPSASTTAYPAPAGAVRASLIQAPSGNIACSLADDTVACTIFSSDYASKSFGTCGATTTLKADATSAGLGCGTEVSKGGTSLSYGTAATSGNVACVSSEQGISCWNTVSGQSFALARGGWQTGKSGQIEPQNFTW